MVLYKKVLLQTTGYNHLLTTFRWYRTTLCLKNEPTLASCSFDKHGLI